MIYRVPSPPLLRFAPHKTPQFLNRRGFHAAHCDGDRLRTTPLPYAGGNRGETERFVLIP
jgi:hypothetical protein